MRQRLIPDTFYDVKEKDEFEERFMNSIEADHTVIGLEIASIDDDTCSVKLVPSAEIPREYSVSSQILKELYMDSVIELKNTDPRSNN